MELFHSIPVWSIPVWSVPQNNYHHKRKLKLLRSSLATGKFPLNLLWSTSTVLVWKYMKLIVCHQSFSIAVHLGFNCLISPLGTHITKTETEQFEQSLIPSIYDKLKLLVAELVQGQQYVICTTDIRSSQVYNSLLSYTAHFITNDFERRQ